MGRRAARRVAAIGGGELSTVMSELNRVEHANGVVTYESPLLRGAGVPHGFTTRLGGISPGPYDSLNLAALVHDPDADDSRNVAANFRKVRKALGCQRFIRVQVNQVHGCNVWQPPADPVRPVDAPRADAIATDKPGLMLMVRVADCVPVLLSSGDGRIVSAVHAGWRGVVSGVVGEAVKTMNAMGAVDVVAAVGPCIGVGHFEVGPEVVEAIERAGLSACVQHDDQPRPHVDLSMAVTQQLETSGIGRARIDRTGLCTYEQRREFFSHRRDRGRTGRQAALIALGS